MILDRIRISMDELLQRINKSKLRLQSISNLPISFSLMKTSFSSGLTKEDIVMISLGWMGNNKVSFETTSL